MEIGSPDEQPDIFILPKENPIPVEVPLEDPIELPEKEPAIDDKSTWEFIRGIA